MDALARGLRTITLTARPSPRPAAASSARRLRLFSSSSSPRAPAPAPAPAAPGPYPFCSATLPLTGTSAPAATALPTPRTDSLMRTLNAHLASTHPHYARYLQLFGRRDRQRLRPGSVLTVTSYATAPTAAQPTPATTVFSGVLIALRRRHHLRDTSIRLRNLVGRTGVEQSFKVLSPLIRDIQVVARAETSGPPLGKDGKEGGPRRKAALPAARRAKMYFVRDQPQRLVSVAGIVRAAREREAALAARKGRR